MIHEILRRNVHVVDVESQVGDVHIAVFGDLSALTRRAVFHQLHVQSGTQPQHLDAQGGAGIDTEGLVKVSGILGPRSLLELEEPLRTKDIDEKADGLIEIRNREAYVIDVPRTGDAVARRRRGGARRDGAWPQQEQESTDADPEQDEARVRR